MIDDVRVKQLVRMWPPKFTEAALRPAPVRNVSPTVDGQAQGST